VPQLLRAQVPQLINYQGRLLVGTTNFNGNGQFKFALVNAAGTTAYWTNDGTHLNGTEPTNAVALSVSNGLYSVLLGDTSLANMTAVPAIVFNNGDVRLRVWFNDGTHGSEQLAPDQRIVAVGFAVISGNVSDGAITSTKMANGSIGVSQLANGSVTSVKIDTTTVQQRVAGSAPAGQFIQSVNADGTVVAGSAGVFANGNAAIGEGALPQTTTGGGNAAFGLFALFANTTGGNNMAVGPYSLVNNQAGNNNTAVGFYTLVDNQGSNNTALGAFAGNALTTGSNNIDIGHPGVVGESSIIRIGTTGTQTDTFLTGIIHGDGSGLTNLPGGGANAVTLVDGNNVTLGRVISSNQFGATVLTSTGYQVTIPFDGVFQPAQIYYTGASCTGTGYLNDGGSGGGTARIGGKWVVFSGSFNSLMEPDTVANGTEVNANFTAATLDNPTCGANAGARSGWKLKQITRVAAGLPATIALPITEN